MGETERRYGIKELPRLSKKPNVIAIQPIQWSELPDVENIQTFSEIDARWIHKLYSVLKKYNQQDGLGVAMLHRHFEIADDEFLLETTDVKKRTQLIRPMKKNYKGHKDKSTMAMIVKLVEGRGGISMLACRRCPVYRFHHGN
jgi:hypothetical protein